MKIVWHHMFFNSLQVNPEDCHILITESLFASKSERERIASVIFDTFKVSGIMFCCTPTLALIANGATTGVVLDSGHGLTQIMCIYIGDILSLTHQLKPTSLGGDARNLYANYWETMASSQLE